MSLRYKALIAVVVLVAFLTGFLVVSSSTLFEEDARQRIRKELRKDRKLLENRISYAAQMTRIGLKASAASGELNRLFSYNEPIGDGLRPFTEEWRTDAGADISIACIDSYVAQDLEANILYTTRTDEDEELLAVVALDSREQLGADERDRILGDDELVQFMNRFYLRSIEQDPGAIEHSQAAVLPVAGRVYLVVQNYLWEQFQDKQSIGVGAVLIELSESWLKQTVITDEGESIDDIQKIVFAGDRVASWKLDDAGDSAREQADHVLLECLNMGAVRDDRKRREFEFQFNERTHLGIAFSSELAPRHLNNRPGFIAFKDLEKELAPFNKLRERVSMIGAGLGLVAAIIAYFGAYLVIRKLRRIEEATVKIREGKFDTQVDIRGRDELGKLGKAFNDMTNGLKALGMYTHETLAKNLLDNPELLNARSTRREGSVFFSDIKGFTSISESMGADELTEQLNEYFAALGRKLREQRGYVDKFIGDSIMAFWGPPFVTEDDYAVRACETAIECLKIATRLRSEWESRGKPLFFQRIGIATGEVVIGNIGTDTKKNFTVIGDSVNVASRLEGANKLYGTEILVDERTFHLAQERVVFREVDQIRVVGKNHPVRVYEPRAMAGAPEASAGAELLEGYARALGDYRSQRFAEALGVLGELLQAHPGDGPSKWLYARCEALKEGVPEDWRPVTTATSK